MREPDDDLQDDDIQEEPLPQRPDLVSSDDDFSDDGVAGGDDPEGDSGALRLLAAVPGPLIAAATFVPTFLVIFFGLSYVVGALQPASTASAPAPAATALLMPEEPPGTPPLSESLRDPFVAPRALDPPPASPVDPREVTRPADPREPFRAPGGAAVATPAIETPGPTLPPAQPRAALIPRESRSGRPAEPPRQPQAAVLHTTPEQTPAADSRKGGRDWTPAAAFADREAAKRLASSIQQQGYPVEIRHEPSSSRPWAVWIGAQASSAGARRR